MLGYKLTKQQQAIHLSGYDATLDHFNDFYVLEELEVIMKQYMASDHRWEYHHAYQRLYADLIDYRQTFNELFARRLRDYIWSACLGEARHSRNHTSTYFTPQLFSRDREDIFRLASKYPPTPYNVKKLVTLYNRSRWSAHFGGKAWGDIAKACLLYEKVPAATFIDHVADLQHNGGTVFSKEEGSIVGLNIRYETPFRFMRFLNYKFEYSLLKNNGRERIVLFLTRKTQSMIERHNNITGTKFNTHEIFNRPMKPTQFKYTDNKKLVLRRRLLPWIDLNSDGSYSLENLSSWLLSHSKETQAQTYENMKNAARKIKKHLGAEVGKVIADAMWAWEKTNIKLKAKVMVEAVLLTKIAPNTFVTNLPAEAHTMSHDGKLVLHLPSESDFCVIARDAGVVRLYDSGYTHHVYFRLEENLE